MQLDAGKRRKSGQVNLTPLIDVVFILLLFFLLSSTFAQWRELNVTVSGQADDVEQQDLLEIQLVSSLGDIRVAGQLYAADALNLQQLVAENPNTVFAIDARDGLTAQAMITLADRLKQAGAERVSLAGIAR
ncbi:biopolymer transporter ExbD [Marinobacter sp. S6332]|uniref:ExbD/TolR family protein n=1 Tax=Marinobacter sp. S6332 TaxID=2926403 RepID=UPI001FF58353|nr:biopolymer transporter ExbD [Marinobacter sp. S6332]MCK0163113.1 biopolymer transporter ExbD [Marinobacter sp. S6332]